MRSYSNLSFKGTISYTFYSNLENDLFFLFHIFLSTLRLQTFAKLYNSADEAPVPKLE